MIHHALHARMQYFLAVGETLSFRKAAEQIGIAQPALSRSIRQLEQQLGFALFERTTRRVTLTPAGETLYRDATEAMQRLTRALTHARKVAQGFSGTIMVGYSTFAATGPMPDIIIEFRKQYPDAQVGLRLLASSEQATAFEEGTIDLGFIMSVVSTPPQKNIPISKERLIALVPARHPWARHRSISLETLVTAPIVIGTASRWRGFRSLVNDLIGTYGLSLNIAEEADDLPVLLQLVQSGFGCTILDASFVSTLPPGIKAVEIEDTAATLDIALAWRDGNLSPLAARFVAIAKEVCAQRQR
ncbi:LysR family transcriptional regulator [Afipia sp. Root123D2]|uniref:LysR family transcriptional regulator n=1 Tax=Afipia sp. Root123D2 TaxID=1736436 RepID=UPI0006FE6270|nr:LysR family transcriptional regulator [Afipia sp. Root123D2]KQW22670.1 LysR family transcriptional regulator [Afipia sp. Root123D2]